MEPVAGKQESPGAGLRVRTGESDEWSHILENKRVLKLGSGLGQVSLMNGAICWRKRELWSWAQG